MPAPSAPSPDQAPPHVFGLTPDELRGHVQQLGLPGYRADQVLDWVYRQYVADPEQMTNLSKADRALLADNLRFVVGRPIQHQVATDHTQKLLVDWSMPANASGAVLDATSEQRSRDVSLATLQPDPSNQTECVMIPAESRRTACISSQVGCPVGCKFCASGLGGLDGNLTAGQIVQQVWQLSALLRQQHDAVGRVTNVVFMGMGEPLANLPNVTRALHTLTAAWGLGLSARRITVSTVGVVPGIKKLARLDLPVTLAISLHAPNDAIRREIIPWAKFTSVDELAEAAQFYFDRTGREVTLEYILLRYVNDRPEHARELATVAKRLRGNVNLIRYNEVAGLPYERPGGDDVHRFQDILKKAGVNTHIRASRGRDIAAACGQLRHEAQASA